MRRKELWIGVVALVSVAVLSARRVGTQGTRGGVAPWDVPDAPNPDPGPPSGAPLVGDPAGLVHAAGTSARLADGLTVELVSVGRRTDDPTGNLPLDARPIWTPGGAPFYGERAYGWNNVSRPAAALEGKGARYLEFRITPPPGAARAEEATVGGYVPDGAREQTPRPELHGWDTTERLGVPQATAGDYRTCVVVDDRKASHYRFALARGDWKVVRSVPIVATDVADAILAQGFWGRLRRVSPPKWRAGTFWKRTLPATTFVVDPPAQPPAYAYEIRVLDAGGRPNAAIGAWAARPSSGRYTPRAAVRVEVAIRPYAWIEFSNVHYDPDPAKWPKGYWGTEGEKAVVRSGGTSLQALIRPVPNRRHGWDPGEVFAPDGRLWRAHPSRSANSPSFSGNVDYAGRLVAGFELEADQVDAGRPVRIEAFASSGSAPGEGLGDSLARSAWSARPVAQIMFPRPDTPFVQFAVRYASGRWTKAGEIAVPRVVFPEVEAKDRAGYVGGSTHDTVFSVALRSYGRADLYWNERGDRPGFPGHGHCDGVVKWPQDEEARVVARLKSGRRVPLAHNSSGRFLGEHGVWRTTQDVGFDLTATSDALYTSPGGVDGTRLLLSEVETFEIETRAYGEPVYLVAKLPRP